MADNMAMIVKRLDSMEQKIDNFSIALLKLAKTEERVAILLEQNTALASDNIDLRKRVHALEISVAKDKQSLSFFERIAWIVATALAGIFSANIAGGK